MNKLERAVDELDPRLSVVLRAMKMRWRNNIAARLIHGMVNAGDVVVDVGANRGVYTYLLSVMVGDSGRVHAVEPFPRNGDRLRAVARWRGNIVVHSVAASDRPGTELLRVPLHEGHPIDALATLEPNLPCPEERHAVPVCTLDDLLKDERRLAFFKCDVEGHEQRVFRGAAAILKRQRPVVLAEVEQRHRDDSIERTFEFFADYGYNGWFVAGDGLHPLEEFDLRRDQVNFATDRFVPYAMPAGYISDFMFCPPGTGPPLSALGAGARGSRVRGAGVRGSGRRVSG